jgi:hypothetical protein
MKKLKGMLILICIVFTFSGCSMKDNQGNLDESNDGSILDLIEVIPQNNTYQFQDIDYASLKEDEYNLRRIIEAHDIHKEQMKTVDSEPGCYMSQYGADQYWQEDGRISLDTLEDMETMFSNGQFKVDFAMRYGVLFNIDFYSIPANISSHRYDTDLIVLDDQYYMSIQGADISGGLENYTGWGVYQTSQKFDIAELAQFYASEKNDELYMTTLPNGVDIYYFTVTGGCLLFEAMATASTEPTTAYLWEQDDVLGVMIRLGEHKPGNLDLCVLERHELK